METDKRVPVEPDRSDPALQASIFAKLLVFVFMLAYITAILMLLVDCWVRDLSMIRGWLGMGSRETLPPTFVSAVFAVLGAVLGCGVLDMVSFHKYVAVKRDFQAAHIWGYFFAPLLASTSVSSSSPCCRAGCSSSRPGRSTM